MGKKTVLTKDNCDLFHYQKHFEKIHLFPLKVKIPSHSPTTTGVYILTEVFMGEEIISYIGSSKWLRSRLYSHPVIRRLKKEGIFGNLYVIPTRDDEHIWLERDLIFKIKPKNNIHLIN